jgi:hypothetical protein
MIWQRLLFTALVISMILDSLSGTATAVELSDDEAFQIGQEAYV